MRWWLRLLHGRDPADVRPACATCGYLIEHPTASGVCPECGTPYIPSTIRFQGPMPDVAWLWFWTLAPPACTIVAFMLLVRWPYAAMLLALGMFLLAAACLQLRTLSAMLDAAGSDRDRRSFRVLTFSITWRFVLTLNMTAGTLMIPLGCILLLTR